jgi:hypothetical protein
MRPGIWRIVSFVSFRNIKSADVSEISKWVISLSRAHFGPICTLILNVKGLYFALLRGTKVGW